MPRKSEGRPAHGSISSGPRSGPSGPVSGGIIAREIHQDAPPSNKLFAPGYGEFLSRDGKDIEAKGFDEDTGFGLLNVPAALSAPAPPVDPGEPNEDVYEITAGKLFKNGAAPVTSPGHGSVTFDARLDVTEDPEDVYRVWLPAHRRVLIEVTPTGDADVELWNASTPSVLITGAARRRHLLASSGNDGRATEAVSARNRTRRGAYVFLDVYLPEHGATAAGYRAVVTSTG